MFTFVYYVQPLCRLFPRTFKLAISKQKKNKKIKMGQNLENYF